jgi:outer membrane protein assembly factor BamB
MQGLAVVPIFMSAGAAVLPTVMAACATVVAVAFKPRELVRLCRQKPRMMGGVGVVLAVVVTLVTWFMVRPAQGRTVGPQAVVKQTDWARVAQDIIEQEPLHKVKAGSGGQAGAARTRKTVQEFTRAYFAGGASPTKLAPAWNFRPEGTLFIAVPTVNGKRIYVAGCQADLGNYLGLLACLDAETGKPVWQVTDLRDDFLKPFFSSPVVTGDGKYMLIGQGLHEDKNCELLCLETATGKVVWTAKTALHIESSPAIYGDMVVVGAGAIEGKDGRPTGDPGYVFATRIADGKELWRQAVNDPESAPVIDEEGMVYIGSGFNGAAVVALRSETDEELKAKGLERVAWKTPVAYPVTGPLTLAGDVVIAGGGNSDLVHSNRNAKGQVVALDKKTGKVLWQVTVDDAVLGAMACRDGVVLCPSRTGEIVALSLKDGGIVWRTRISGNAPCIAGCAFTDKLIYAVSSDGYLAVLDPKTGRIQEKVFVNDKAKPGTGLMMGAPQVFGGRVLVPTETGGLRCYAGTALAEEVAP